MLKMRLFTAQDAVNNKAMSKHINVSYAKQSTPYGVEIVEMIAQKSDETTNGFTLS
jgi:hypothetical protein